MHLLFSITMLLHLGLSEKIAGGEKAVEKFPLTRGNTFFASIGFIAC